MSRYQWPAGDAEEHEDAPGRRAAFLARGRGVLDGQAAREAGRSLRPKGEPGARAPATSSTLLWQPLGALNILGGQASGTPRVAGRINALAVHEGGQRVYAAAGTGGVWYSKDGGEHWASLGGFAATDITGIDRPAHRHACGAIFVEWGATEATDVVYVGTGEVSVPTGVTDAEWIDATPGLAMGGVGVLVGEHPATAGKDDPWVIEAPHLLGDGVYRFAKEPGGSTLVAATRTGLYQRPAVGGAGAVWTRVAGTPFNALVARCTDVLWTPAAGPRPARLWVWVESGPSAGLWVRSGSATNFSPVPTTDSLPRRAALASAAPHDQIWVLNDRGDKNSPALFRVASASAAAPVAERAKGVPVDLMGPQGFYDICLAVVPGQPNRVVLGGSFLKSTTLEGTETDYDAAIVVGDVALKDGELRFAVPGPFTHIGIGVHADVHDLVFSNAGARLWTGCDGGVFRSDKPAAPAGFGTCNNGLSIFEANYLGCHPRCEGRVIAGLQDNGVVERLSNGVWRLVELGDGGSIVFDPLDPRRFLSQYVQAEWRPSDGSHPRNSVYVRGDLMLQAETTQAAFYSTGASIAHRRGVAAGEPPDVGQIIVGTERLWYSEDFGLSWVTLPTATDPLLTDYQQDRFGEAILVCRWQSPDVAWVLGAKTLKRFARTPGSDAAKGPGTWDSLSETILKRNSKRKKDEDEDGSPVKDLTVWTDIAVNLDTPPAADQPPVAHGSLGALYLGTAGQAGNSAVDTLWWFDGTDKWVATRLRDAVAAPVTAIVCDPQFPLEVYVGTTVGVWKGQRSQVGGNPPTWTWIPQVNGLPEATVEDLSIFNDGELRLLRAGIAARGVWELRLDLELVPQLCYLRVHADDLRHRERSSLLNRDLSSGRSWHASPDIRPRLAPVSEPAPASLPWYADGPFMDPEQLRRFQAALRSKSGDRRVRATGRWDTYFNEVLRDLGAPILPGTVAKVCITPAFWNAQMSGLHATHEPWGVLPSVAVDTSPPSEADLYEFGHLGRDEPSVGGFSQALPRKPCKVDVLVQHRGKLPVDGALVRVTLLKWIDPATPPTANVFNSNTWFSGNVPWAAAVSQMLNSADGKSTAALGPGWSFVRTDATKSRRVALDGQTLDPAHPGVATFDLNLSALAPNTLVLLVAVIRTGGATAADDIHLDTKTLLDLACDAPQVAVRSISVL